MNILHPHAGAAGVYFPIGLLKNGGTCEFANKVCLEKCCAKDSRIDAEYKIHKRTVKALYKYMITQPIFRVLDKIMTELEELEMNIIHWFASGDCQKKDEKRIYSLIESISREYGEIIQCGFTRNYNLWDEVNRYTENTYLVLTQESDSDRKYSDIKGLIGIPDYETNIVHIWKKYEYYGGCGGSTYEWKEINEPAMCSECFKKNQGCFYTKEKEQADESDS